MSTCAFQRYYYAKSQENRRTEQSLDVYEAILPDGTTTTTKSDTNTTTTKRRPTIVLVMGSGWLGHVPWIYVGTNWWNASGPQTIAKLGYKCISVRHRGGFFQIPSPISSRNIALVTSCFLVIMASYLYPPILHSADMQPQEMILEELSQPLAVVGLFVLTWIVLYWQSQGAAQLSDMVQDVDEALSYIQNELHETHVIVGGYSSGGHVVATWLSSQRPQEGEGEPQKNPQLPPMIRGILYLSAVLSLDSTIMNFVTLAVFGKWAREVPSPYTNRSDAMELSPMPFASLPHFVVGCRQETFGVPLLDATFCYQAYTDALNCHDKKCVLIDDSNHWSILNSRALSQALQDHLPWLIQASEEITAAAATGSGHYLSSDRLPTKAATASTMTLSTSTSSGTSTMDTDYS